MGKRMYRLRRLAVAIPRQRKQILLSLCDGVLMSVALLAAWALVYRGEHAAAMVWFVPVIAALVISTGYLRGLYRSSTRFIGGRVAFRLFGNVGAVAVLGWLLASAAGVGSALAALTMMAVFAAFSLLLLGGMRFLARSFLLRPPPGCERVLIYGAGWAGAGLEATLSSQGRFLAIAFVDDREELQGTFVNGLPVLEPSAIAEAIVQADVKRVFLALPSAKRDRRKQILRDLEPLDVRIQTVPDTADLASGRASVEDIRDITVDDILGREPVKADPVLLSRNVRGKAIMVTGAGGSIGSELCRQLLVHEPRQLVLFELSEIALYNVERQLQAAKPAGSATEIVPLLGNVQDARRVNAVLDAWPVETVYHAAAYKHVPIVECNISEGIRNNALGTRVLAQAARDHGVGHFVLVSTDKAVRPTNVMGASKRLAELVLQAMHTLGSRTRFCIVRFGNVLESSGSVVPLFREQIRNGGPVTVTHKDVTRYFMTIPEAAQLVIQAGTMSRGGDVFLLEMGDRVRIADLAERLIRLSGLKVKDGNSDGVEIRYTGLRKGEKLHEELLRGDDAEGTDHPKITRAMEDFLAWEQISGLLNSLEAALDRGNLDDVRVLLLKAVDGYRPESELYDHVMPPATGASITFLPTGKRVADGAQPASEEKT
jgi:FlaA1/EpsC-like NDP-sugar epimerase